jgi:hypothetical protein
MKGAVFPRTAVIETAYGDCGIRFPLFDPGLDADAVAEKQDTGACGHRENEGRSSIHK